MDATPDPQLLYSDLDQILRDAQDQITEERVEETVTNVAEFFSMTRRQARNVIASTNTSIATAAEIAGLEPAVFLPLMTQQARLVMLAFTAGAVHQHDIDSGLNPETGEQL